MPAEGVALSQTGKLDAIQWLRALAACEVVIWHSDLVSKHFSPSSIQESGYAYLGGIGVELFFFVSGYIICKRSAAYSSAWSYISARVLRIYPLYIFFTSLVILAFILNSNWPIGGLDLRFGPILTSMLILPQPEFPILGVGWTLEHEMIFYVSVFVLLLLTAPAFRGVIWQAFPFLIGGLGAAGLILGTGPSRTFWDFHLLSPYLITFAFGWLICSLEKNEGRQLYNGVAISIFLFAFLLTALQASEPERSLAQRIAIAGLVFSTIVWFKRYFQNNSRIGRAMSLIGDASYSTYLSHWFVLSILGKILGKLQLPAAMDLPVRVGGVVLATAVGIVFFLTLERPLDRLLRRRHTTGSKPTSMSPDVPVMAGGLRSRAALDD